MSGTIFKGQTDSTDVGEARPGISRLRLIKVVWRIEIEKYVRIVGIHFLGGP